MLKLRTEGDRIDFLLEVSRADLIDSKEELPESLFEDLIKKRKALVGKMTDFRKSQTTKRQWRTSRWTMLLGINKFHRSIAGKRLHRSLGRFLATRIFRPGLETPLQVMKGEALKGVSSIRTHLYIETGYYMPLPDEVSFSQLLEYAIPVLNALELKIFREEFSEITEDELELLLRCVDRKYLELAIREIVGTDIEDAFDRHSTLMKEKKDEDGQTLSYASELFLLRTWESIASEIKKKSKKSKATAPKEKQKGQC